MSRSSTQLQGKPYTKCMQSDEDICERSIFSGTRACGRCRHEMFVLATVAGETRETGSSMDD